MSEVKKKLLEEIDQRIAKRKEAKARAITRNTIDAFVLTFIKNIEDLNTVAASQRDWEFNANLALNNLMMQMQSYDRGVKLDVSWYTQEESRLPEVNGVLIKWSPAYQKENNCEPELFVDVTTLLFD